MPAGAAFDPEWPWRKYNRGPLYDELPKWWPRSVRRYISCWYCHVNGKTWKNECFGRLRWHCHMSPLPLPRAALKATLHVLRDRMPPDSAVHLGGQLPTVIRGLYYEKWHMAGMPTRERHLDSFLDRLATEIPQEMRLDPESAAWAVFEVMSDKVDHDEIAKVIQALPLELRDLWPLLAQLDAAQDPS